MSNRKFLSGFISAALLLVTNVALADKLFVEGDPPFLPGVTVPQESLAPLVKELSPAVVNISVEADPDAAQGEEGASPVPKSPGDSLNPFLRKEQALPVRSLGSGIILSEDGYIVTNSHVVGKATTIIVRLLNDKTEYSAKKIGIDPKTDVALLKIEPNSKLKVAYLGDSDKIDVGDGVIAIGNQFQLGQTVTSGIVSATSRRVMTGSPYDAFIQTDASINPGSSGGPLFNLKGQVVGINTAIFSPGRGQFGGTGFNIGIGFAIPINLVKGIVLQLKNEGKVTRGMLGVMIQSIDADTASALGLSAPNGALVSDIIPNSPAASAGIQKRDVIISFNGIPVNDHDELPLLVANTPIGTKATFEIVRFGKKISLSATIKQMDDKSSRAPAEVEGLKPDKAGILASPITPDMVRAYKLPGTKGVYVEAVEAGSAADRAGIIRGDVIEEVSDQGIEGLDEYQKVMASIKNEKPTLILVRRSEGTRYVTLKIKSQKSKGDNQE